MLWSLMRGGLTDVTGVIGDSPGISAIDMRKRK
jgi:hypothetical protein